MLCAERLLPHSTEAEEARIGSLLIDSECVARIAPLLQPGDFYVAARYSDDQGIRDEFQRMMETATGKSSPFDHVVVWRLRYFAWNLDESIQARDRLAANGIQLLSVKEVKEQLSRLRMSSTEIRISRLAVGDVGTGGDPLEQIAMGGGHVVPPAAPTASEQNCRKVEE